MDNTINIRELEDVKSVKLTYIYINSENEIEDIMMDEWECASLNMIYQSEIIEILKKYISNRGKNTNTYTIMSLIQYNVDLPALSINEDGYGEEEGDAIIREFINDEEEIPFFNVIKTIRDIYWKPTVSYLKDLNELIIIFYANRDIRIEGSINKTKKVYLHSIHKHKHKNNSFSRKRPLNEK